MKPIGWNVNISKLQLFIIDADLQSPTELLWTKFFLAQHYDYVRNIKCALLYIDEVLTHTPTLIEGYMVKAKILKVRTVRNF